MTYRGIAMPSGRRFTILFTAVAAPGVVCPECGGPVTVTEEGLVDDHRVWWMTGKGLRPSKDPAERHCPGAGQPAEAVTDG